ncbi:hypothetical protein DIPPA_18948 [Diplonema papillatum]|nr:hypothetical protein DIPPA_18948 [Diplonema papillatum]
MGVGGGDEAAAMLVTDPFYRDYDRMPADELRAELQIADQRLQDLTNQQEITDLFPQIERLEAEARLLRDENERLEEELEKVCADADGAASPAPPDRRLQLLEEEAATLRIDLAAARGVEEMTRAECAALAEKARKLESVSKEKTDQIKELLSTLHQHDKARGEAVRDEILKELQQNKVDASTEPSASLDPEPAHEAANREELTHLRDQLSKAEEARAAVSSEVDKLQKELEAEKSAKKALSADARRGDEARAASATLEQSLRRDLKRTEDALRDRDGHVLALKQEHAGALAAAAAREKAAADAAADVRRELAQIRHTSDIDALQSSRRETAQAEKLAKRLAEQAAALDAHKAAAEKAKEEADMVRKQYNEVSAAANEAAQRAEAGTRAVKDAKKWKEQLNAAQDRLAAAEEEKQKLKRDLVKATQAVHEGAHASGKLHELNRSLAAEVKKLKVDAKRLQELAHKNDPQQLKKELEELAIANNVLKEMVRSANINTRVAITKHRKGLRPPDESTLLKPTKSVEGHKQPPKATRTNSIDSGMPMSALLQPATRKGSDSSNQPSCRIDVLRDRIRRDSAPLSSGDTDEVRSLPALKKLSFHVTSDDESPAAAASRKDPANPISPGLETASEPETAVAILSPAAMSEPPRDTNSSVGEDEPEPTPPDGPAQPADGADAAAPADEGATVGADAAAPCKSRTPDVRPQKQRSGSLAAKKRSGSVGRAVVAAHPPSVKKTSDMRTKRPSIR